LGGVLYEGRRSRVWEWWLDWEGEKDNAETQSTQRGAEEAKGS